ncbi:hypothetical protein N836_08015 [Leptolyngbya sp. Heron Island J]|uniref:hypothetical protein n=1 Tax=Leptolyngbya sp. Heron Island J TaxID=1385935 RepID=UPI0003B9B864|nr:hypothetical protein [Leptolyngbya sp. Heron Island J]ESA36278.1 hypothetical protein N836_08015 [Leptolyngbya sp. Heron Island J]
MNTYPSNFQELEVKRRQLERLWQPTPVERLRQKSGHLLRAAGQWLVQSLTEGNQLRIWLKETKKGSYWCVYDPSCGLHRQFDSEEALRVWLEQRYSS